MEEEVKNQFSLQALFIVTGSCFLSFALGLRIVDGVNNKFFLWSGFITFMAGVLTGIFMELGKKIKQRSKS